DQKIFHGRKCSHQLSRKAALAQRSYLSALRQQGSVRSFERRALKAQQENPPRSRAAGTLEVLCAALPQAVHGFGQDEASGFAYAAEQTDACDLSPVFFKRHHHGPSSERGA